MKIRDADTSTTLTDNTLSYMTEPSSPKPAGPERPAEKRLERIARRAREIYEARGGEHGRDLDDWLAAERQIDAEIEREEKGG